VACPRLLDGEKQVLVARPRLLDGEEQVLVARPRVLDNEKQVVVACARPLDREGVVTMVGLRGSPCAAGARRDGACDELAHYACTFAALSAGIGTCVGT
jgi:hypothetical protein